MQQQHYIRLGGQVLQGDYGTSLSVSRLRQEVRSHIGYGPRNGSCITVALTDNKSGRLTPRDSGGAAEGHYIQKCNSLDQHRQSPLDVLTGHA